MENCDLLIQCSPGRLFQSFSTLTAKNRSSLAFNLEPGTVSKFLPEDIRLHPAWQLQSNSEM